MYFVSSGVNLEHEKIQKNKPKVYKFLVIKF